MYGLGLGLRLGLRVRIDIADVADALNSMTPQILPIPQILPTLDFLTMLQVETRHNFEVEMQYKLLLQRQMDWVGTSLKKNSKMLHNVLSQDQTLQTAAIIDIVGIYTYVLEGSC